MIIVLSACVEEHFEQAEPNRTVFTKSLQERPYYWYYDEKIYLTEKPEKQFVILDHSALDEVASYSTVSRIVTDDFSAYSYDLGLNSPRNYNKPVCGILDKDMLSVYSDKLIYSAPYFVTDRGHEVGISNLFSIKLKNAGDLSMLYSFAVENNVSVIENDYIPLWHILSCTNESSGNALELANKAYESGLFAATSVDFLNAYTIDELSTYYNDPEMNRQWNLTDTYGLDIYSVHAITTGTPTIKVAVIDTGFQLDHPDLNVTAGWDATSRTSPARLHTYSDSGNEKHGTRMAGIIGAQINNNEGIVGVAPDVTLIPISVKFGLPDSNIAGTTYAIARAIVYAASIGADVINCSWGSMVPDASIHDAVSDALAFGRDGKGCIIVQGAGNESGVAEAFPYSAFPVILCVGNMEGTGRVYLGSKYGPQLDVVAPGMNIYTTDTNSSYKSSNGTSPACPHVAATAALMLSVNPDLTRQEVADIIEKTARKLPAYTFTNTSSRPNGAWNEEVGYGLVNCLAAVKHAYYQHESLIEFDYSGVQVSMRIKTQDDVSVFWDYDMTEVTHISAGTVPYIDTTITHTYSSSGIHHIIIAEPDLPDGSIPSPSAALIEFELPTGVYASNIDISHANSSLRYIKIVGGEMFEPQALTIENMIALEELYLVGLKYADVAIRNCSELETICTSPYVWTRTAWGPELIEINSGGTLNPNLVGGSPVWPTVPEPVIAPCNLNISGCSSVSTLSLENVNCTSFSFGGFPSLRYVYLSSLPSLIVGAGTSTLYPNPGYYLSSSIATLPDCPENSMPGTIVIRAINNSCTSYIPVSINSQYKTAIENNCASKGWGIIWDSGVTVQ